MRIDQSAASGKNQFSDSERFSFALQAANIGTWDLDPKRNLVWWDERCRELHGFSGDVEVPLEQIIQCVHEEDRNRVRQAVNTALNPASGGNYTVEFRTTGAEDYKLRWVHSKGQAFFNEKGEPYRFSGIIQDITDLVNARQQLESSERHWRNLIDHSPSATAVFIGPTMQIQAVNQSMLAILNKDQSIIGKDLLEALPEFKDQPLPKLVKKVYETGHSFYNPEELTLLVDNGQQQPFWFRYAYEPLRNEEGETYGVIHTAISLTEQVEMRKALEVREQQFKALLEGSLLLKWLLDASGQVTFQNQRFMEITGLTLQEIRYRSWEILIHPQEYDETNQRIQQGLFKEKSFIIESRLRRWDGQYRWYEIELVPLFGAEGDLTGWVCRATDVHEQKMLQNHLESVVDERTEELMASLQELEEKTEELATSNDELQVSQNWLASIFSQAPVAIAVLEGPDYRIKFANESCYEIWQVPLGQVDGQPVFEAFPGLDGLGLQDILARVRASGIPHRGTEQEATLLRKGILEKVYINYVYAPLRSHDGSVDIIFVGTEVTQQVLFRHNLEESEARYRLQTVELKDRSSKLSATNAELQSSNEKLEERTHELALSNEELKASGEKLAERSYELAASNEELKASSEELSESNQQLSLSNDRLQRFAYVASHDLQEPLRKIQTFGSILSEKYAQELGEQGLSFLSRMSKAGEQMSTLIQDLLTYSRMVTRQETYPVISLQQVMARVLDTLDLSIQQTQARLEIDTLPAIQGDELQLGQLFQNLISNAIKFSRPGEAPVIRITTQIKRRKELPHRLHPISTADRFQEISISDQGIGFDEQFIDRIFEVFQRLHDKKEFVGTGIGLAICQRVVENHGGGITARSMPGQGATFFVYLPA